MFKRVLNAKKNKRAVLAVVAVFLVMSAINAESYGVTIDFYGMAQYSGSNNLTFANGFVPVLPTQSDDPDAAFIYFGTATTPISIDRPDPYYGIAAVAYDLDYSVPEWDQSY
ncbi:MAG: hypothetical protein KKD07_10640, partial [Candidatus Omnitrophica bacterium]|nr:hypothetical protein [Candidatus Omnitrophota bacterium]